MTRQKVLAVLMFLAALPSLAQKPAHSAPDVVGETTTFTCSTKNRTFVEHAYLFRDGHDPQYKLASQIDWKSSGLATIESKLVDGATYVIQLSEWKWNEETKKYTLTSSAWYIYESDGTTLQQRYAQSPSNKVLLPYGSKTVIFAAIQVLDPSTLKDSAKVAKSEATSFLEEYRQETKKHIDEVLKTAPIELTFNASVAKGNAENISDLGAVLGALAGLTGQKNTTTTALGVVPEERVLVDLPTPVCMEMKRVRAIKSLPFDLNLSFSFTPKGPEPSPSPAKDKDTDPSSGDKDTTAAPGKDTGAPINCSQLAKDKPCTIARTFTAVDKEWWDISLGVTLPGVRESKFSFNSQSSTVVESTTLHTDIYGFVSLYPFSYWRPKNSWAPHINVGIPFTGQPLHRPFFGAAEKIPGSDKLFKVPAFFYGGVVRLIETVPSTLAPGSKTDAATFSSNLRQHVVWKGLFGVEFPVGSLLSRIGKSK